MPADIGTARVVRYGPSAVSLQAHDQHMARLSILLGQWLRTAWGNRLGRGGTGCSGGLWGVGIVVFFWGGDRRPSCSFATSPWKERNRFPVAIISHGAKPPVSKLSYLELLLLLLPFGDLNLVFHGGRIRLDGVDFRHH